MNVLKRLAELTELSKSELASEAGFEGRTYDLFSRGIEPEREKFLKEVVFQLEKLYIGRRFSKIFFTAIRKKVENDKNVGSC